MRQPKNLKNFHFKIMKFFVYVSVLLVTSFTQAQNSLSDSNLDDMLWGLGITASGGGGGFEIGENLIALMKKIPQNNRVLKKPSEAPDNDWLVVAGGIGKPSALTPESLPKFIDYVKDAIKKWEEVETIKQGKPVKVGGLLPVEAGPVNGLMAMYIGWSLGLDVYDCDGAGRAVPSLFNLTYNYNTDQYPIAPFILAGDVKQGGKTVRRVDEVKNADGTDPKNGTEAENAIGRYPYLGPDGEGAAGLVLWGQTGKQLKESSVKVIENTFSNLIPFGQSIRLKRASGLQLVSWLKSQQPNVYRVEVGTLVNITKTKDERHDFNTIDFLTDLYQKRTVLNENESLLYKSSTTGYVYASAPSTIAFLFYDRLKGYYVPYNLGDEVLITRKSDFIDQSFIVVTVRTSETLFKGDLANSFREVLKTDPFNYTGNFVPSGGIRNSNEGLVGCWRNTFGSLMKITSHNDTTGAFEGLYQSTTGSSGTYSVLGQAAPTSTKNYAVSLVISWNTLVDGTDPDPSMFWTSTMSGYNSVTENKLRLLNVIAAPGPFPQVKMTPGTYPESQIFDRHPDSECEKIKEEYIKGWSPNYTSVADDNSAESDALIGEWKASNSVGGEIQITSVEATQKKKYFMVEGVISTNGFHSTKMQGFASLMDTGLNTLSVSLESTNNHDSTIAYAGYLKDGKLLLFQTISKPFSDDRTGIYTNRVNHYTFVRK